MQTNQHSLPFVALLLSAPAWAGDITGLVIDTATGLGVPDARVALQASTNVVMTAADGSFVLTTADGTGLTIVAAKKGYYHGPATVNSPALGVVLQVTPVQVGQNPSYSLFDPAQCGSCHPNQLVEWTNSPMNKAGKNSWIYDIFDGSASAGGLGGFVYLRDSVHAASNPESECASCHQPEPWIQNGFSGGLEPYANLSTGALHGVSCEICHKVADVDVTKTNYPGIWPGALTYNQPPDPLFENQVEYGVLGDVSFSAMMMMQPSYQPQLVAEVCAACHQDKNDPDEDNDFEESNGVISEPTYLEWAASAYSNPANPEYASCVTCHMPPTGSVYAADPGLGAPVRDPNTIRSHNILGTTAEFLDNAVELSVEGTRDATGIDVTVTVDNTGTGHHVPTGVTVRNMILLVEAVRTSDGAPLTSLGTQTVHALGGVGSPAQGYYSGLPGKLYAKVNHNASGNGPTFYTDATGIQFDTRIPALTADQTQYRFAVPPGTGEISVRARLVYRRAWRALVDAKQWTTTGHGAPLEDVQAPHFGHLMEDVTLYSQDGGPGVSYCTSGPNSTGSPALMSATGSASIAASNLVLQASNIPNHTFGLFVVGTGQTALPLVNGTLCVSGPLRRFPVIGPTTIPVVSQPLALPNLPGNTVVQPGDTRTFQFWFRDTAAGGALADLSNGYAVTFQP